MKASFKITGLKEVLAAFEDLAEEIGDKKATGKVLVPAVREAMQPVLAQAVANAPVDTGGLRLSLQIYYANRYRHWCGYNCVWQETSPNE